MKKTTLYIIAYDISNDKRRSKVHKALSGFGEWTQFSLFECFLTDKDLVQLRAKLDDSIDPEHDSVRFYPICEGCQKSVQTIGSPAPEERVSYIL